MGIEIINMALFRRTIGLAVLLEPSYGNSKLRKVISKKSLKIPKGGNQNP